MSYTIKELQDYSLNFEVADPATPNLFCLYKEGNLVGTVSPNIKRDGSVSHVLYHAYEGYRFDIDSSYNQQDAKNQLVSFHIKNYEDK